MWHPFIKSIFFSDCMAGMPDKARIKIIYFLHTPAQRGVSITGRQCNVGSTNQTYPKNEFSHRPTSAFNIFLFETVSIANAGDPFSVSAWWHRTHLWPFCCSRFPSHHWFGLIELRCQMAQVNTTHKYELNVSGKWNAHRSLTVQHEGSFYFRDQWRVKMFFFGCFKFLLYLNKCQLYFL